MTNLIHHIEYLLLRHDHVAVPGFGEFLISHKSAYIYEKTLIPPVRVISYNPYLSYDDGLLADSYARKYKLSLSEAKKQIADEVKNLKKGLQNNQTLILGNLGRLFAQKR